MFVWQDFWQFFIYSCTSSVIVVFLFLKYVRPKFQVKVNCWFCNSDYTVPYGNKNCWDCPSCEQYNGFSENGDYNKPIPSQYDELFNPSNKSGMTVKSKLEKIGNGLCEVCNGNQLLKIKQLSAFVPQYEESFDVEVDAYEKHLDSIYKLCSLCEMVLHQKLGLQDSSMRGQVMSWKLRQKKLFSSTPTKQLKLFQFFCQVPLYIKLLQLCSLTMIVFVCIQAIHLLQIETRQEVFPLQKVFSPELLTLLISDRECNPLFSLVGFFILIATILAAGKDRLLVVDALDCFAWLVALFVQLPFMAALFPSKEDRLIVQGLSAFVGIIFTVSCFVCSRPIVSCRRSWNGSRANASSCSSQSDHSCGESVFSDHRTSVWQTGSRQTDKDTNKCAGLTGLRHPSELLQDHQISTTTRSAAGKGIGIPNLDFTLGSHLQAMKISTPRKPQSVSGIFTPKIYSSPASPWMTSHQRLPFHHSILSPARLQMKSIAHSSWVAGGYWASANPHHHCRSLFGSQSDLYAGQFSNGFSHHSNISCSCPTSPANSVCGDDKLSAFSEPARAASPSAPFASLKKCNYPSDPFSPIRDVSSERSSSSSSSQTSIRTALSRKSFGGVLERNAACTTNNQLQQISRKDGWKRSTFFKMLVGFSLLTNVALLAFLISTFAS